MLGKGLESLIPPQRGNTGNNQNFGPNQNQGSSQNTNPVPSNLPAPEPEQSLPQPEPQLDLPVEPVVLDLPQQSEPAVEPPVQIPVQPTIDPVPYVPPPSSVSSLIGKKPDAPLAVPNSGSVLAKVFEPAVLAEKKDETAFESIFHIEIDKIKPNPDQPRRHFDEAALRDLANSIREFGIIQPLVVTKIEKETQNGVEVEYLLIAGERRYLASKMLGLPVVPAIVRNIGLERERLELAVIENIQRENLNPIETARAFQRLQEEFRMTQREIAAKLGKSREVVANTMRLLDLPEFIREAVEKGELSESHARLLLTVGDPGAQKRLFEDIVVNKLTTRDVKERVQSYSGARRGRPPMGEEHVSPEVKAMESELSSSLGAPVEIHQGAGNGKITITFYSEEELTNILQRLGRREL
jgi:ParB family chromosome partitioning protein